MLNKDNLPYRPCIGAMILNTKNQAFVAKRVDNDRDAWQMPQGGIDAGETPEEALFRELKEEIGTNNVSIIARADDWLHYDIPDIYIPRFWNGRYRGQKQRWFLVRFNGADDEINIDTVKPEFSTWKWTDPHSIPEHIVAFKRPLYEDVLKAFAAHL